MEVERETNIVYIGSDKNMKEVKVNNKGEFQLMRTIDSISYLTQLR
jgi:hypothetical protein